MSLEAFGVGRGGREGERGEGSNTAAVRPSAAQLSTKGEGERDERESERAVREEGKLGSLTAARS